jgi:hypothetical protein
LGGLGIVGYGAYKLKNKKPNAFHYQAKPNAFHYQAKPNALQRLKNNFF